tara:strand:- start:360 stop:569 length:210 start_codon:yes stop_codon:yes gene_type:complete
MGFAHEGSIGEREMTADIGNEKLYWLRTDTGEKGEVTVRELIHCINSDTEFHEEYFLYASIEERDYYKR